VYYASDERRNRRGLFKVPVDGGPVTFLQNTTRWQGVSWGNAEPIVYANDGKLWRVSVRGSSPEVIVTPDRAAGEDTPGDPYVLPDGKTVSFRITTRAGQRLGLGSIAGGKHMILDLEGSNAISYVDGWLVFGRVDGRIGAAKVNLATGRVTSDVIQLMDGVKVKPGGGLAAAVSRTGGGTAAFIRSLPGEELRIVDDRGAATFAAPDRLNYYFPAWSPDGRRIAVNVGSFSTGRFNNDIWILDTESRAFSRLGAGDGVQPTWTPDGKHIAYIKRRGSANPGIYWILVDGSAPEEQLAPGRFRDISFARDGRLFAAGVDTAAPDQQRADGLWSIDPSGNRTPRAVVTGSATLGAPMASPDGRWVVYQSDEAGRHEVYVRSLSSVSGRAQVSSGGGSEPRWSPDGRRIFYRSGTGAFVAAMVVAAGGSITITRRDSLFPDRYASFSFGAAHPYYDVHPDGKRFVVIDDGRDQARVEVVVNWLTELRGKLK
ncbi:MAG: hypothetical protein M3068_14230, partial [Gemmatimonadota bacterium]|nr:hypothetical protein [Gemmatimonadota bacterium]MDQ6888427.1 hypothetical protein [Gemmatimonadota bacterium]